MKKNSFANSMLKNKHSYLLAIFIALYVVFFFYTSQRYWNEDSTDFPSYYYAAKTVFSEKLLPYDYSTIRKVAVIDRKEGKNVLPFLYPPPSLIIFAPFTKLDYESARKMMLILNIIFVLILAISIAKIVNEKLGGLYSILILTYVTLFFPLKITIDYGQVNIFVILLICMAWLFIKKKYNPFGAALMLALSIMLKLYPILLIIPLWIKKEYKVVFLILITLISATILSMLLLPNGIYQNWYVNVGSLGYTQKVSTVPTTIPDNQSLYGFLARIFYGHGVRFAPLLILPTWITDRVPYVASFSILCISIAISFFSRKSGDFDILLALWLVVSYLIAPISWYHHLVLVLPAILVTLHFLIYKNRHLKILIPVIGISLFWLYNYPSNSPLFREGSKTLLISLPFYFVFLFWLLLGLILLKSKTR